MSNPLLERMAALKASSMAENTSVISNTAVTHTLSTFLIIYSKTEKLSYIRYCEGANALLYFLTSGGIYKLDLELDKYPKILDTSFKVPMLMSGYESYAIAKLIAGTSLYSDPYLQQVTRAIYLAMLDLANRGLI